MVARTPDASGKTGSEDLARMVRQRREELGLTRQQLADATGIPYPTVAQIETAYRGASPARLGLIARALGLDPKDLFDVLASSGAADAALSSAAQPERGGDAPGRQGRAEAPTRVAGPWHANPRFAAMPAAKAAGSPAPMAAPAPGKRGSRRRAGPPDDRVELPSGTGDVVDRVVELLSRLPADVRIDALGRVQSRLLEGIVEERIERDG